MHRGLFDDEDKATTVHCQSRLQQISEEALDSDDDDVGSSECGSDGASGSDFGSFDGGPAKSALTSYSMTSSVLPRNENLTLLDDMFEKVILSLLHCACIFLCTLLTGIVGECAC